jgi:small subunit ribosomal protein S16
MAVKIRMQRGGATHNPHYRVVVTDVRSRRDGRFVEKVGVYDPKNKDQRKQYALDLERVDYWLSVGAQPSDTVRSLIKRARRQTPAVAVEADPAPVHVAAAAPAPVVKPVAEVVETPVEATTEEVAMDAAVEETVTEEVSVEAAVEEAAIEEAAVEGEAAEEASEEESSEKNA